MCCLGIGDSMRDAGTCIGFSIVLRKMGYNPNYFILIFLNRGRTTFATTTYSELEASRMHSFFCTGSVIEIPTLSILI